MKTVGGAIASCVFGIALAGAALQGGATEGTAGSFGGYVTVWVVCGTTALVAAVFLLVVVPRQAFTDPAAAAPAVGKPAITSPTA